MRHAMHRRRTSRARPARSTIPALPLLLLLLDCGSVSVADGLERYREAIEDRLAAESAFEGPSGHADSSEESWIPLPRRRLRRIEVPDQRMGPFDFLAIVGCPLSEIVARRNGSLGRVLPPTLRLRHEIDVLAAGEDCLPSLNEDRAARLRPLVEAKRRDFGAHVWNAVWLSDEVERFLSSGPRSLVGGRNGNDAARQLARAASAIAPAPREEIDVDALADAFEQLRDDAAIGPLLRDVDRVERELSRVAARLTLVSRRGCDNLSKLLSRDFRERYLPLQARLGELDRRAGELLPALDALYRNSSRAVEVPLAMEAFAARVLDVESSEGLWRRYRSALRAHAEAWQPLLESCGLLPGVGSATRGDRSEPSGIERIDA